MSAVAYAATTEGCTFLLDEDGVCRRVLLRHERRATDATLGGRTRSQAARRCIGAQYVASIDVRVDGGLVPMPRLGMPMLFAYTDDDGRLAVLRTGALARFETVGGEPHEEIPVDWADDTEDDCRTVPLHQSGERRAQVRLQKVNVVGPSASAPTLKWMTSGKGMLPKKTGRG